MSFSPDGTITGMAVTGLTSPTFTVVNDPAVAANQRRWTVTALGGTQTNARANSVQYPFHVTLKRSDIKQIPAPNPVTGYRGNIPKNRYELIIEKGVDVAASTPDRGRTKILFEIPAGAESYDVVDLKSMLSFLGGLLTEEADDFIDTFQTGTI